MFRTNAMKAKLKGGEAAFGVISATGAPLVSEMLGLAGYDFVLVDAEHGPAGQDEQLLQLLALQATSATSLIRIPEWDHVHVKRALDLGFHGMKLKTTLEDPDPERLEAIRSVAGEKFKITLDPNGRYYRLDDALPRLLELDAIGNLGVIEDPFPRFHLEEFAALRPRLKARVVLHIDPPESFPNVIAARAAGGLNIDSHAVGPFQWRVMAGAAEMANLPIWHGSGLNLGVYTALQLHLSASAPNCVLPGDQIGPWVREATLVKEPFTVRDGCVAVPEGPGIGVTPDMEAIEARCVRTVAWEG